MSFPRVIFTNGGLSIVRILQPSFVGRNKSGDPTGNNLIFSTGIKNGDAIPSTALQGKPVKINKGFYINVKIKYSTVENTFHSSLVCTKFHTHHLTTKNKPSTLL